MNSAFSSIFSTYEKLNFFSQSLKLDAFEKDKVLKSVISDIYFVPCITNFIIVIVVKLDVTQSNFLNVLKEEIVDESHDVLLLTGSAGTGKTQIIKEAIDYCKDNGIASQCLAFTGRAASVLRERNRVCKNYRFLVF